MAKPDSSFKYRIGQCVTPRPPADRPQTGRFTEQSDRGSATSSPTLRLLEEQLAPLGQKG